MKIPLFLVLLLLAVSSVANPTSGHNSLGVVPYQDNPLEYRYGRVTKVDFPEQNGFVITNLAFQPVGTYATFTEQVPLCGDQRSLLDFTTGDVVLITMSKRMTRRYCHDLLRIDVITGARTAGRNSPFPHVSP